jgi:hypothetical protein
MKLSQISRAAVLALFFVYLLPTQAQQPSILELATTYSRALQDIENGKNRGSIESLFDKGKNVSDKLEEMEGLTEADYSRLTRLMRGFVINRDEVLYIEPDSKFFARLSRKLGTRKDVSFFVLKQQLRPDNVWAAYIEQETDSTGCTQYGNGSLTRLYGQAVAYRKAYPNGYRFAVNYEIEQILERFSSNICGCGNVGAASKEFRSFVTAYPQDKNTPKIAKTMNDVLSRKNFHFDCQPF